MHFIEFNESIKTCNWSMNELQSHDHFEAYFLEEGKREFFINNSIYTIEKNTFLLIPPYTMHKTEGGPFKRIIINIYPDYFSEEEMEIINIVANNGPIHFNDKDSEEIVHILLQIKEFYNEKVSVIRDKSIHILINYLFLTVCRHIKNPFNKQVNFTDKQLPEIIIKIIKYINDNISEQLTVKNIAKKFFITEGYLSKLFRKSTNCSMSDYILNLRISIAKEKLRSTKLSIEKISAMSGFSSANYFSLIFKRKVGIAPVPYRKYKEKQL